MEVLIKDVIAQGKLLLQEKEIPDADIDSMLLAEYVFGITKSVLYIEPERKTDKIAADRYMMLIRQRADRIPLQHLTGTQEFMGLTFRVNEKVLIPRQDTEILVEKAVRYINSLEREAKVLDMCTGSGCIAVSIDKFCPLAKVTAADISEEALETAAINNQINDGDVNFVRTDLFDRINKKFDLIISNPPYIKTEEIDKLMDEVRLYEPRIALDGEADGLKFYREISCRAGEYLKDNGKIMYEIGYDQGKTVPEILNKAGLKNIEVFKDLSGNDRVVTAGKE